ncbi:hypothetical protein GETHLI_19720 [Geothrix limicola]|uniref:TonB-dependent receptor n=1 Tax=Geothrix limicola TaxID=2927978 RepID=A0ABQ5QGE8_9BACT|nr:TonB-dependent receptor [Geothrix limicola]GLH73470.1 hypothetical protein GETHLI_19720 [Geothrix limicola]
MRLTSLTLLLAVGTLGAAAPEGDAERRTEPSATVTVTAEGQPVELAKTPNPVKVITREQIDRSGTTNLRDLLQTLYPGQLVSNGGLGTATSFNLGGARNQDVVVLLDGLRLTDASGLGSVNPASIGLVGIERIEVEQGPCSTRFGAEAAGGVVALYTAAPAVGLSGRLQGALGTRSLRGGQAEIGYGGNQGLWFRAGVAAESEEQALEATNPYRNAGVHLALGLQDGGAAAYTLTYRNTYVGVPIPWAKSTFPRVFAEDRETRTRQEQVIGNVRVDLGHQWLLDLSLGQATQARQEPNYMAPYTPYSPYDSRRNQANASLAWHGENTGATTTLTAYEEHGYAPGYPSGTDHGVGRHVGLSQEGWFEPVPSLRLSAGLRQQWDRQTFLVDAGPQPDEMKASTLTGRLGATWQMGGGFRSYASVGTAFGLPFLSAVMYNQQNGGEALDREKSRFAQVGAAWEGGPWYAKLEASRTQHDNLVIFDLDSYLYANAGAMRIQGTEATLGYRQEGFLLEGFYRNQEARDTRAPQAVQLQTSGVIRRPFQSLGLKGSRTLGAWRGDLGWGWSGASYENFGNGIRASRTHFNQLDAALAYKPRPAWEITLRGAHLLQRAWSVAEWKAGLMDGRNDAALIAGYPAQPRTVSLEAAYRF